MSDFNQVSSQLETSQEYHTEPVKKKKKGRKVQSFLSMVTAGVVGSMLTIVAIPNIDALQNLSEKISGVNGEQNSAVSNTNENTEAAVVTTATTTTKNSDDIAVADMVEASSKAIVGIVNLQEQTSRYSTDSSAVEAGSGSGVIFKVTGNEAYIVTNNHVIEGASEIEVSLYNGEKASAQLIGADALTDLAVLKIDSKDVEGTLEFGDSSTLRAGEDVLAIGNPLGLEFSRTVTQGIVSATERTIAVTTSAGEWELNVIQTDAAINPGNSGGALLNSSGQVIGINSLKISEDGVEGLGFAIPSNDVVPIVNQLIESGQITRPYIGVSLAGLEELPQMYLQEVPETVTEGAMVMQIDSSSAAAKAGLAVGDVIVSIDDVKVTNSNDLRKYLYNDLSVGDEITLKVYSKGQEKTVTMTLTGQQATS
ncbi:trypsin-like peptidase domain-containing protein [Robertmurraya korlensis]|uniref:S1C family serine protease n=1 Tax=Robertmurraya korlensis TaxID=519977 RepID=UPI00203E7116|nr:trypsin-like peptidase domain-containing protein [Robertmurraya korlensis]MCM3602236.1 trypsin-like peptidase domain-containing protein [Robertmurraya korlensis]